MDEMNVFAQSAMTRPLFEEPSDDIQRPEPWTGPKGFLIGGMALPTKEELSQQYFDAANLLIEAVKRDQLEDYRLTNPVLFLYRHSLELLLKGLMGISEGHDLAILADDFRKAVKGKFGKEPPGWMLKRLNEVAGIDPGSTAFRYGENYDRLLKQRVSVDGEIYVCLPHLQEAMFALNAGLVAVWETGKA